MLDGIDFIELFYKDIIFKVIPKHLERFLLLCLIHVNYFEDFYLVLPNCNINSCDVRFVPKMRI
jgi:hypothetical protein